MADWSSLLRPELADLAAYVSARHDGIRAHLDANEAPPLRSPRLREVVERAVARTALERYPDARASELRARIAERTGARPEELLIGTGSDEVIALVLTAMARPRELAAQAVVLTPSPTFVMYRIAARAHGVRPVEVPLDSSWDLDVRAMARAVEVVQPSVVFLASPNNPTGNRLSDDRVQSLLAVAGDALVVIDEAYVDFAGESRRSWRERFPRLGIMRTLSKVGLAALRVGWLEADAALVGEVDKARAPFNVSATSQAIAADVLSEAWPEIEANVRAIVSERERVASEVRALGGYDVAPSAANFLWIGTPQPAAAVSAELLARGVLVRSFHAAGGRLANRVRVTTGARADNDRFLEALRSLGSP